MTAPLFATTFIHTSAVVARAAIIRDAGGFDGRLTHNEDYDLWLRLSLRHRFGLIPEPLCLRRCHRESLSRNGASPEVLLRKPEVLWQFYENGGPGKIPAGVAKTRLAKLYYTAGRLSFAPAEGMKHADSFAGRSRSSAPDPKHGSGTYAPEPATRYEGERSERPRNPVRSDHESTVGAPAKAKNKPRK